MNKKEIVYTYRGHIERGADYHWTDGYSATTDEGHVLYPWMTKQECRQEAKRKGARAVFVDEMGAVVEVRRKR